ncbi:antiviral reverse transcriptase Drt3b [Chitinophaga sp. 22620]|uniref:antiviral reverse transcriptase Drt3b n=1 Tax=Chitinophaga sp. 22620 TaxID=3453952 RepID=UPI003F875B4C
MGKKKIPIKYKKERVVIADILPYEIPVTFSNRHFYDFLVRYKVEIDNGGIKWKKNSPAIENIIQLLFGINKNKPIVNNSIKNISSPTIPFNYKISHKENDFRTLTIIHPKSQVAMVEFYEKYKEMILHYCNNSPFSIRRAHKVAKFKYFKDKTHINSLAQDQEFESFEEHDKEYEHLKTYFVYKNYGNIHKFYESYKYHRCEKKYNKLLKFDISKCFDSIYTHSITWALINKDITKLHLSESDKTFGGEFDALMQKLNYNETNGIVIGPEFSRIFAELILQRIDNNVFLNLKKKGLYHKKDYEVFRYVDDFFVFYNNEVTKEEILKTFRLELKEYKFYLNDAKNLLYEKPIITEITIAKQKITEAIKNNLIFKIEENNTEPHPDGIPKDAPIPPDKEQILYGSIYVSSNKLITKIKTIIKETKVEYKDILNYTLSLIDRHVAKIIKDYKSITKKKNNEKELVKALLEILDVTFFLYAVSPRVNTTIKLSRILRRITEFLTVKNVKNLDFKHLVFKKIYDNVYFILHKNKTVEHTQVETLYLLITLSELGKEYWLNEDVLCSYFNIEKAHGKYQINGNLNYFSITVLLFYMKDKKRYADLKKTLLFHVYLKFNSFVNDNIGDRTELTLLLFDLIVCPYLELDYRKKILNLYGITDGNLKDEIIKERKFWFTKWSNFNLGKELDAKQSQEVY